MAPSFEKTCLDERGDAARAGFDGRSVVYDFYLKYESWKATIGAYALLSLLYSQSLL